MREKIRLWVQPDNGKPIYLDKIRDMRGKFLFKDKPLFLIALVILVNFFIFLDGESYGENRQSWIKKTPHGFIKDGKPFRFIGASAVNMVFYDDWDLDIEKAIRTAKENNISVLRFYMDWGWSKDEDFDKIVDMASRYGIYVILTFTDCCCSSEYPSFKKYLELHASFCNIENKNNMEAFKKRIKKIIQRRNSINGKVYRDDSTILAWEIANELEYWHFSYPEVHKWVSEIGVYIKSLDKNHLITISVSTDIVGFDKDSQLYEIFNVPELDFISFHFYPTVRISNSDKIVLDSDYPKKIEYRIKKFLSLNKPVVMGEFGFSNSADLNHKFKTNKETGGLYNLVFKKSMDSAFLAGASGAMFWGWGVPEEKTVPMWWRSETHNSDDEIFCRFLKQYHIPDKNVNN